jgi:two-component system NtrC family response regulator
MGGVRTSRPTVLTVDDEPGVRESVRLILEDAYAVEEASSGWGAIEQIRGRKPDVVLLDVKMPDLDGLSVLEIVRAKAPGTKIVLLTGLDSARAAVTAMKLGALDYLTKPIDEDELLEVVSRAVRSTKLEPVLAGELCVSAIMPDGGRFLRRCCGWLDLRRSRRARWTELRDTCLRG